MDPGPSGSAVYYFDSWVKGNWEHLEAFFVRGGTVNLFLPDPEDELAIERVRELFSEYSSEAIREKIANTSRKFAEVFRESGSKSSRINYYLMPRTAQYSAIQIDSTRVLLSVYEAKREDKIDSSALLIDLTRHVGLSKYWDKEFGWMMRSGNLQA